MCCLCMVPVHIQQCSCNTTVILEIFDVKIFSWLAQPMKIYHMKYFTNE